MKKIILLALLFSAKFAYSDSNSKELTLKQQAESFQLSSECVNFAEAVDKMVITLPNESAAFKTSIESFISQWHNFDKKQLPEISASCQTMADHINNRLKMQP